MGEWEPRWSACTENNSNADQNQASLWSFITRLIVYLRLCLCFMQLLLASFGEGLIANGLHRHGALLCHWDGHRLAAGDDIDQAFVRLRRGDDEGLSLLQG